MKARKILPKPRHELVRQELLNKAAEVFSQKGYSQTTILDVADALQLSRSALYHYFRSKEDILLELVEDRAISAAEEMKAKLAANKGGSVDKLRMLLTDIIQSRIAGGPRMRVLDQLANDMPPDIKARFERGRRDVLEAFADVVRAGVESGELRPVDPKLGALAVLGIASWTSWWYSPTGRKSPDELAPILVDIALNGLLVPAGSQPAPRSPQQVIRSIRQNLEELEKSIKM